VLSQNAARNLEQLEVIDADLGKDICAQLGAYLAGIRPDLVFCGQVAMGNLDTGLVPYILANQLGITLIDNALSCKLKGYALEITQFMPKGQRRVLKETLPAIITCSNKSAITLEYLAHAARRGKLKTINQHAGAAPLLMADSVIEPSKLGRKRLSIKSEKSAFERLHSKVAVATGHGQVIKSGTTTEKADHILNLLVDRGVLKT
jgi:electron transfer flavoprotein beta subunit